MANLAFYGGYGKVAKCLIVKRLQLAVTGSFERVNGPLSGVFITIQNYFVYLIKGFKVIMLRRIRKIKIIFLSLVFLFNSGGFFAQDWSFRVKSKVELRSWILSSRAEKKSESVKGAKIKLYKGSVQVAETASDEEGNFEMTVPSRGDFTLLVEYPGCDAKKFVVRTRDTPKIKGEANFRPTVDIAGLMASNPPKDGRYLGLDQTHIQIKYNSSSPKENKNFYFRQNIYDAEYLAIQKFCIVNRLGDMALEKKNYELARKFYTIAATAMGGEQYPKEQLKTIDKELKLIAAPSKKNQKVKATPPKQVLVVNPKKSSDFKNSSNGRGRGKIRKTL